MGKLRYCNMLEIYELRPTREQNQESFYGKALVHIEEDGTETLWGIKALVVQVFSNNR